MSTYGIRPHLPLTPDELLQITRTVVAFDLIRPSRWATEAFFGVCLSCRQLHPQCECHERGRE